MVEVLKELRARILECASMKVTTGVCDQTLAHASQHIFSLFPLSLFVYSSVFLPVYCLFLCLFVCRSDRPPVCLPVSFSLFLSLSHSFLLSVSLYLSVAVSLSLPFFLTLFFSLSLSSPSLLVCITVSTRIYNRFIRLSDSFPCVHQLTFQIAPGCLYQTSWLWVGPFPMTMEALSTDSTS